MRVPRAELSDWCRRWVLCMRDTRRWPSEQAGMFAGDCVGVCESKAVWANGGLQEISARSGEGRETLGDVGVDVLFAPDVTDVYPDGFRTYVNVEGISERLEGRSRPGHFRGVSTVVLKLFEIVQPHFAYFGRKDAQQVRIIGEMARDLNLDGGDRGLPGRARGGWTGAFFAQCVSECGGTTSVDSAYIGHL